MIIWHTFKSCYAMVWILFVWYPMETLWLHGYRKFVWLVLISPALLNCFYFCWKTNQHQFFFVKCFFGTMFHYHLLSICISSCPITCMEYYLLMNNLVNGDNFLYTSQFDEFDFHLSLSGHIFVLSLVIMTELFCPSIGHGRKFSISFS